MMNKLAAAAVMGTLLGAAGGALAADMDSRKMAADKDGMISVQQAKEMECARIGEKMKAMGIKGDKMPQADWDKLREDLYRGI